MLVRPGKTLRGCGEGDDEPILQREQSGGWRRGELQEVACGQGAGT